MTITIFPGDNILNAQLVPVLPPPPPGTANLSGIVRNSATGVPVADALVSLAASIPSTTTDIAGKYQFVNVTVGVYTIICQATGYNLFSQLINLLEGNTGLNITLEPIVSPPPPVGTPGAGGMPIDIYQVDSISSLIAWTGQQKSAGGNYPPVTNDNLFILVQAQDDAGNYLPVNWSALVSELSAFGTIYHSYMLAAGNPFTAEHLYLWVLVNNRASINQVLARYPVIGGAMYDVGSQPMPMFSLVSSLGMTTLRSFDVSWINHTLPAGYYFNMKAYFYPAAYSRFDTDIVTPSDLPNEYAGGSRMPFFVSSIGQVPVAGSAVVATLGPYWQPRLPPPRGLWHTYVGLQISSVPEALSSAGGLNAGISWVKNMLSLI